MIRSYNNLLIRQKLQFMIMATSIIALLLAFSAFSVSSILVFNEEQKNKTLVMAEILADNSEAALSFLDKPAAGEILSSLKAEEHVTAAAILDKGGKVFVSYPAPVKVSLPERRPERLQYYRNGFFHTFSPVVVGGEKIGEIYLRSDTGEIQALAGKYLLAGMIIILFCTAAAYVITSRLQKSISVPVHLLTEAAEKVSREKNYSLRAAKTNNDELGTLVDRFNEMLEEIQKREEALLRSNRDLEQFAYVASHDLQEPLRMIINYAELMSVKVKEEIKDEESRMYFDFIMEGARRSQQLISDLLEFSRLRSEGHVREINFEEVLANALSNLKYSIEETGARITHGPLPVLSVDPLKFAQVFQNLIANAIKFRGKETPHIHIEAKHRDQEWFFSVKDNGIGIDPAFQERIFVIFKRLHSREVYPGTGIGLAICKRIVDQAGGRIWVESELEKGASFYFTVPDRIIENKKTGGVL